MGAGTPMPLLTRACSLKPRLRACIIRKFRLALTVINSLLYSLLYKAATCQGSCIAAPPLPMSALPRARHMVLTVGILLLAQLLVTPVWSAPLVHRAASWPQLICLNNAVIAWDLIVYLTTNFILHAISVPVGADIGRYTTMVTRKDASGHRALVAMAALFMPFFALARAIILIAEQLKYMKDDIRAALYHGALLVIVRDHTKWRLPPTAEGQIIFVKLPEGFNHGCIAVVSL